MRHLATAEDYIKQNSEIWEKAGEAYEILPEKEAIIEMLKHFASNDINWVDFFALF